MGMMPDHSDLWYKDSYFEKFLEETGEVPESVSHYLILKEAEHFML